MSGEKTEEATQKKIEDARKKGQVAVSKDGQTLAKLLAFYIFIFWIIGTYDDGFGRLLSAIIDTGFDRNASLADLSGLAMELLIELILPILIVCVVASVVATWLQVGMVFAPEAVVPSFKKFDFVQNIKGMFSKKSFVQLFVSLVKVIVLTVVAILIFRDSADEIVFSYRAGLDSMFELMLHVLKVVVLTSLAIFIILSVIDWIAVFFDHKKNLRMSKNEVKDENKQLYGDPTLKNKRKQLHRNLINSSLQNVSQAKAVVANPTHIAVALDYEPGKHDLPYILAMGEDADALLIRKEAEKHGIPIVRNIKLARMLYAECEEEEYIQKQHLELAAEVFRLVFGLQKESGSDDQKNIR